MGKPGRDYTLSSCTEYIGVRGERRELKHLSTCRNRNQNEIPSVVASESGTAQTGITTVIPGLWGPNVGLVKDSRRLWKVPP